MTKLLAYNTKTQQWSAVHYPLENAEQGWVGLSEITAHNNRLYILERDNQIAGNAKIKRLYQIDLADLKTCKIG